MGAYFSSYSLTVFSTIPGTTKVREAISRGDLISRMYQNAALEFDSVNNIDNRNAWPYSWRASTWCSANVHNLCSWDVWNWILIVLEDYHSKKTFCFL